MSLAWMLPLLAFAADDPWSLFRRLARSEVVEIAVGEGPLRAHVERIVRGEEHPFEFIFVEPGSARSGASRIAVGSWQNPDVQRLAEALGVQNRETRYSYGTRGSAGHGDVLVAWFEDPDAPGLLAGLYLGTRPAELVSVLRDISPPSRPSVRGYRDSLCVFEAELAPDGSILPGTSVARREVGELRKLRRGACDLLLPEEVGDDAARPYAERMAQARGRLDHWIPLEGRYSLMTVRVHAHAESKLYTTGDARLATVSIHQRRAHVLLAPGVPDDAGAAAADTLLQLWFGPAVECWVGEALPVACAQSWWGRPLEAHVARLVAAGRARTVAELVAPRADHELSPHVRAPLRAALFTWLAERAFAREDGPGFAERLWRGEESLAAAPELEREFLEHISAFVDEAAVPREELDFLAGISLEPTGAGVLGGYASRGAARSLEAAAQRGAGAVALSTYAFMDPGPPPLPEPDPARRRRATQSDLALAQIVAEARALSMKVLLQPQLLTSPGGHLAGSAAWTSHETWSGFYDDYEAFLEHYGLLADLLGIELLSVGADFHGAARFEAEEWRKRVDTELLDLKRERFLGALDLARELYRGELTFSARSTGGAAAVEAFPAWDRLDYVSTAFFQRVGPTEWANRGALEDSIGTRIQTAIAAARRVDRRLILLPVGYPSSENAHLEPAVPRGRPDVQKQRELYSALAEAVAMGRDTGGLAGFFLWKWPTDPDAGGSLDRGYTPRGKPAQGVLERLFGQ